MTTTPLKSFCLCGRLLLLAAALVLAAPNARAQSQSISLTAGLPVITGAFNHTSVVSIGDTPYDFNYYDFNVTGFTNVGAHNPDYAIFSFSNDTLEHAPGVVGVASAYLPQGWTFSDTPDFGISTTGLYPDDPQFGLIFIQKPGSAPIDPTGAPFEFYHDPNEVDPFTSNGVPLTVPVNNSLPAAPEPPAITLTLTGLVLGALVLKVRRRSAVPLAQPQVSRS